MSVTKITLTNSPVDEKYLNISDEEIIKIHKKILSSYKNFLQPYGVKPVWSESKAEMSDAEILASISAKEFQLIFLYKHKGKLVHKDLISAFVRKHIPNAGLDQQVRHLSSQFGWNILNKSGKIPDEDITVPSGFHYLVSLETPNPKLVAQELKRVGRLGAKTFEQLKIAYGNKCATCGIEEGKKDSRMDAIVKLQEGHMDPRKSLTLDNTIPQCQYCNQTYKDYFKFNEHGRVIAVNNPEILLQSPADIQDEMIQVLLKERQARQN